MLTPLSEGPADAKTDIESKPFAAANSRRDFSALFAAHQQALRAYIAIVAPDRDACDDIFQQTGLVLFEKFGSFEPGTNFLAWARAVARLEVLKHRQRTARQRQWLSEEAIDAVTQEMARRHDELDERRQALAWCLEELSPEHRRLLRERYCDSASIDALSARFQRSIDAIYQTLSRIRRSLQKCIERRLAGRCA